MSDQKKMSLPKKIFLVVLSAFIVLLIAMGIYLGTYYKAVDVDAYLATSDNVQVTKTDAGYYFDGAGEDVIYYFYPGAKVETESYAPLMNELAENGIDCILLDLPFRMAFFDIDAGYKALQTNYSVQLIGGHSLGGAMAGECAVAHPDTFDGIVLLAAYVNSPMTDDGEVLCVFGSEDFVLNKDTYEAKKENVPTDAFTEIIIDGGNHAGFASYGDQSGDGEALISCEEQWQITTESICDWVTENF